MSSLPNSKSSFFRAARNCSALALASAMVMPMTPVLAQDAAPAANMPVTNAPAVNASAPATQDVADEPSFTVVYEDYYYRTAVTSSSKRATACTPVKTVKLRFWAPASPKSGASSTAR